MMEDDQTLPLPAATRKVAELIGEPVSYKRVYNLVLGGAVPAVQPSNGRWRVLPEAIPALAARLRPTAPPRAA